MVGRFFLLIAVVGLAFMVVGAYIALAQDGSQVITIAISDVANLALTNEARSTPGMQLIMTLPDGQTLQGSDLAQFITPDLPVGSYQLTLVRPDNSSQSYSFQILEGQQLMIPAEWTIVSAPPVVIPPTDIPTEPPVPTVVILPTEMPTELPTAVILPTDVPPPTELPATPVMQPTQVSQPPPMPTRAQPQPGMQTPIVQPQPGMQTPVIQPTQASTQQTPFVEPTQAILTPTMVTTNEAVPTMLVESTATLAPSTPVPVVTGQITGVVLYPNTQKQIAVRLNLMRLDAASEAMVTASDSSGAFQFGNLPLGIYQLDASAPGFLSTRLEVRVLEGQLVQLPPTTLKAGDINQDGLIDIRDVTLVAANFNGPAAVIEADINGDGWIDIRDLSVVGSQFGLAGPLPWN
jgi:hypothetical protein